MSTIAPDTISGHLRNCLQLIAGARATYAAREHSADAQSLYADLMAVEYRIQQALTQVEER